MSELFHECGIAAIYHLPGLGESPLCPDQGPEEVSRIMPRMLLDIQNRGQLAAGFTTFNPTRNQLITTHRDIGTVQEVFRLSHRGKSESLMREFAGRAAIGHVRYATCGQDDKSYAQPFERHHLVKHKWFSFAFNGQLSNYSELRDRLLADDDHHLSRETDTEIIMHEISREMTGEKRISMLEALRRAAPRFDGAYSMVMLNAYGEMLVARDPYGIKPLCYAVQGSLFAAASESVALINIGFEEDEIKNVEPGHAVTITDGKVEVHEFIEPKRTAHCFFEWIYFANVASTLDGQSVYVSRTNLGEELAAIEQERNEIPLDDGDTIVVPVPDTSKAAADAMAFKLGIPSREGLIRNRYSGRTFIESGSKRRRAAEIKYTPLREVLEGKRIFLVEDSIVRSTTMKVLINRLRERGGAKEIHVRVACPPIIAPCFYGIDMSTISELFAPKFMGDSYLLTEEMQDAMAEQLGADSLRYLPVDSIARAVNFPGDKLCQACITGEYPTPGGERLYQIALESKDEVVEEGSRTYERRQEEHAATSTGA
ncbi:amidophosphoribosyltransferase [Bremerella sp. JC817]|uniref:amidophosphoribosyltransferase n=1 Tax=Bremerella sp. JC817 TaxID=3231756 RepID=UPI00345828EF